MCRCTGLGTHCYIRHSLDKPGSKINTSPRLSTPFNLLFVTRSRPTVPKISRKVIHSFAKMPCSECLASRFSTAGPRLWNSLPEDVQSASLLTISRQLKHYFYSAVISGHYSVAVSSQRWTLKLRYLGHYKYSSNVM